MSGRTNARAMAYDAMHDVILSTARLNGKRLAVSCIGVEGVDLDILAGALDGIVSYAIEVRTPDQPIDQFTAKMVTALQEILTRRTLNIGPTAGTA
jgi:hypothetical protein